MIRPHAAPPRTEQGANPATATDPVPAAYVPADDRARRIQIGLAGLAGILLMIGLASMIRDPATVEKSGAGTAAVAAEGNEPLADPGTTAIAPPVNVPGTATPEPAQPEPVPPAVVTGPATSVVPDLEPETPPEREASPPR